MYDKKVRKLKAFLSYIKVYFVAAIIALFRFATKPADTRYQFIAGLFKFSCLTSNAIVRHGSPCQNGQPSGKLILSVGARGAGAEPGGG